VLRTGEWLYSHVVNEQPPATASDAPADSTPAVPADAETPAPPQLPPGYVWAYQGAPEPEKPWKAPRWLIALSILWAIGLVASGTFYALRGQPTVREQTTVASSQPTVDQAIDNVVRAAGPGAIVAIGSFEKSAGTQILDLFVAPGTESVELKTIAKGLPSSYSATAGPGNVLEFSADAGDYVGLIGAVPSPGQIEIKAETGCREPGPAIPVTPAPNVASGEMTPVRAVLNTIGVLATSTAAAQIPCSGSSAIMRTVSAQGPAPQIATSLAVRLATVAARPTVSTPNLVAYRAGTTDIVAARNSNGTTVSSTTRC
jgi:hypothetical protein